MTTRRDFLKGFAALASGLALAPASALAQVQRLGTPNDWVESADHNAIEVVYSGRRFTVKPGLQNARLDDPRSFVENEARYAAGLPPLLPGDGSSLHVGSDTSVIITEPSPWFGEVKSYGLVTIDAARGGLLRIGPGVPARFGSITVDTGEPLTRNLSRLTKRVTAPPALPTITRRLPRT